MKCPPFLKKSRAKDYTHRDGDVLVAFGGLDADTMVGYKGRDYLSVNEYGIIIEMVGMTYRDDQEALVKCFATANALFTWLKEQEDEDE
jgi:Ca2+-binding RTX toxin-like protein